MQIKIKKKTLWQIVIPAAVLAVLVATYFIIQAVQPQPQPTPQEPLRYEPIEGEALDANRLYPIVTYEGSKANAKSLDIFIEGESGSYGIRKLSGRSTLYFYTLNDEKEAELYYPPIAALDANFDYTSMYATDDMGLGTGIPRVMYLAVSMGNIGFYERIPLSDDQAEKGKQLKTYGLDDPELRMTFKYTTAAGLTVTHTVSVGGTIPGNGGYYCMVDDRPYVYATSTDSMWYAMQPLTYYIQPALISPGTTGQTGSQFEGYITVEFREYVNRIVSEGTAPIPADAKVIVEGSKRGSGAEAQSSRTLEFDLKDLQEDADFARLVTMLTGKTPGAQRLQFTQRLTTDESRLLSFAEATSHTYQYTITRVDALLTSDSEITDGTVASATLLKVRYRVDKGDGEEPTQTEGILDLTQLSLDTAVRSKIEALPVGTDLAAAEQVTFSVTYTEQVALKQELGLVVDEILAIYTPEYEYAAVVAEDSLVYCRYHYTADGEILYSEEGWFDMSLEDVLSVNMRTALLGKSAQANLSLTVYTKTEQYEFLSAYIEYTLTNIMSYVCREEVVAFGFQNEADRDPFYSETYFSGRLPVSHPYHLYGLDDNACQAVIRALGGMQDDANRAAGLFGTQTVAIGLTPALLLEYGLYANTVYLEVPRGITTVTTGAGDTEFRWQYTLPYTIFVSDVYYDPDTGEAFRYAATDLYDLVVRIDADVFSFLDKTFPEYWAREKMLIVDIADITSLRAEAFFDDLKGTYEFLVKTVALPNTDGSTTDHRFIELIVGEGSTNQALLAYMQENGKSIGETLRLNSIYDYALGVEGAEYGKNYAGDGYFSEWLLKLFSVEYRGTLSEEEQAACLSAGMVYRLTLDMKDKSAEYVFEFYRGTERQVMVRMYQSIDGVMSGTPVQEFYISTLGLKELVSGIEKLLAGKPIDSQLGYDW